MGKNITKQGEPFFSLEAAGSDYEIGKQIGAATADDIAAMWEDFTLPRMVEWYGTTPERYGQTYDWLRKNLEKICPWMVEQIDGMARGSGVPPEYVWMMNHYPLLWPAHGLFCSSMSLRDSDAGPVLAQNLDIGAEDLYYVTKIRPAPGHAVLSDAMGAMCWSPTGINDRGLAVGSSNLAAPAREVVKPLKGGIVNTFMPRMVLRQCGTTGEAIEFLQSLPDVCPPISGYQLNIIDAEGHMAVVDKTGPHLAVRQCERDMNFTTNYSLDPAVEAWRMEGACREKSDNARRRAEKMRSSYAGLGGEKPTVAWLKKLFRSHDAPGRLCRHGDEASAGGYSRLHMVYYPRAARMEITNGPPCRNDYETFQVA